MSFLFWTRSLAPQSAFLGSVQLGPHVFLALFRVLGLVLGLVFALVLVFGLVFAFFAFSAFAVAAELGSELPLLVAVNFFFGAFWPARASSEDVSEKTKRTTDFLLRPCFVPYCYLWQW